MIAKVNALIESNEIVQAYELCIKAVAEKELSKGERKVLALLAVQCVIRSIELEGFFDHFSDDEETMIYAPEHKQIVKVLEDQITEMEYFLPFGDKAGVEEIRDIVFGFLREHYLSRLDEYVSYIVNMDGSNRHTQYSHGHICLLIVIINALMKLSASVRVKGVSYDYDTRDLHNILARKLSDHYPVMRDLILQLTVDFPFFAADDAKEVSALYFLTAFILRQVITYLLEQDPVDEVWVTSARKILTNILCDHLNAIVIICDNRNHIVSKEEMRQEMYDEVNSLETEIRAREPNYSHPPCDAPKVDGGGGCYVATAVYGSYDCPQVWTLRRYRDDVMAKTFLGKLFIKVYYAISPTLVKWFGQTNWFRSLWKGPLDRLVQRLQNKGISSDPYLDQIW